MIKVKAKRDLPIRGYGTADRLRALFSDTVIRAGSELELVMTQPRYVFRLRGIPLMKIDKDDVELPTRHVYDSETRKLFCPKDKKLILHTEEPNFCSCCGAKVKS